MACLFGHKWNGCKCTKCGKMRNENHNWSGCKCTICGKTRDEQHIFMYKDWCGKCEGTCTICGKEVMTTHDYKSVPNQCYQVCSRCGEKTRPKHDFKEVPGKCMNVCAVCGAVDSVNAAHHTFIPVAGKCVDVCAVCGVEASAYTAHHTFVSVAGKCAKVCEVCGTEEDRYKTIHTWEPVEGKCEEKCAVCGATRTIAHQYAGGICVRCGWSIDAPGPNGIPPLLQAAYDGDVEKVRKVIAAGANVNLCVPDETPLMAAAKKGYDAEHKEIVRTLLDAGANINATDMYGSSALRLAQRKGLKDMVDYLASRGGRYLGA